MTSLTTSRIEGTQSSVAVKAPCRVATTANITLSGLQTIDGTTVVADDRVLVKDQTTASENGIYLASSGTWERAPDFDGARDAVQGTLVSVYNSASSQNKLWELTTSDPDIGTDSLSFSAKSLPTSVTGFAAGTAASPGLPVTTDTDTGLYRSGSDELSVALGGQAAVTFADAWTSFYGYSSASVLFTTCTLGSTNSVIRRDYAQGRDSSSLPTTYTEIRHVIADPTNGSENGAVEVYALVDGTETFHLGLRDGYALFPFGSASGPGVTFNTDSDTGMYRAAADTLAFATAGTHAGRFTSGQDFVVGATSASGRIAAEDNTTARGAVYAKQAHATGYGVDAYATNASFAGNAVNVRAERAANSAFSFLLATSNYTSSGDTEFNLRGDGNGLCDGSWTGSGADYAEYFEWADGNPDGEDRRGFSVVLEGEKIRKAEKGEDPVGVVSGNPSVVGDAAWNGWKGKYLRDEFGGYVTEEYEAVEWQEEEIVEPAYRQEVQVSDPETGKSTTATRLVPAVTRVVTRCVAAEDLPVGKVLPQRGVRLIRQTRRKLNPDYDPEAEYAPREERREWDTVGLLGKLRLRKGQPTGARWVRMRDTSAGVEEWLVR